MLVHFSNTCKKRAAAGCGGDVTISPRPGLKMGWLKMVGLWSPLRNGSPGSAPVVRKFERFQAPEPTGPKKVPRPPVGPACNMRARGRRARRPLPEIQVLEDLADDGPIPSEGADLHGASAPGTTQRVHHVDLLQESSPVAAALPGVMPGGRMGLGRGVESVCQGNVLD